MSAGLGLPIWRDCNRLLLEIEQPVTRYDDRRGQGEGWSKYPGSHAPHGNPSAPASQARVSYEKAASMNPKRDAAFPKGISYTGHIQTAFPCGAWERESREPAISIIQGTRPCGRSVVPCYTAARDSQPLHLRFAVSKIIVRQRGYLKGGLCRRCVESLTILSTS